MRNTARNRSAFEESGRLHKPLSKQISRRIFVAALGPLAYVEILLIPTATDTRLNMEEPTM
jgi:hypothetical protein